MNAWQNLIRIFFLWMNSKQLTAENWSFGPRLGEEKKWDEIVLDRMEEKLGEENPWKRELKRHITDNHCVDQG